MSGFIHGGPIYKQLTEELAQLIQTRYSAGDQFLTERQVSERFGISRTTANKALANLVVNGVLEFRTGVGTFVRRRELNVDLQRLVSFTAKARAAGLSPATTVRSFRHTSVAALRLLPPQAVITLLGVDRDAAVFEIERVRTVDGRTVIYERRALLAGPCPELNAAECAGSLYTVLSGRYRIMLAGVAQRIRARNAGPAVAAVLGCPEETAVLELTGVGHAGGVGRTDGGSQAGRDVRLWYEETLYRGDAYEFINQMHASGDDSRSSIDTWPAHGGEYAWYSWQENR